MGEWDFLGRLLDKVQTHTTVIGKVWLTSLFVFRILVLGAGAEGVWGDEQSDFVCNTQQPGCERICFNHTFPISHIRFWVLQIVSVSTPTLIYLGHAVHIIHTEKKIQQKMERRAQNEHDGLIEKKAGNALKHASGRGKVCLHGSVLRSYMVSVFCKIILELGFILGQYYLYGFSFPAHHICDQSPCPHNVDCFLSRATEKTIFIWLMLVVACVSFILNLVEIIYLCVRKVRQCVDWKRAPHSLALKRKEFKDEDQALQNWVNMEPELNE